ncbi:MAG: CotH kinase family protein [Bacteroidetes bacterium]|nr:CotH kinase family protein [Bacteroidota bacterium]
MKKLILSALLALLFTGYALPQDSTLFDDTRLSAIYITIHPDSLQVIYDSVLSDHYYMARFIFDDNVHRDTLENVGFRLRGNTSRYSMKKSFKISFSEYVSGRKYQGVKKINLNGEHNDPTMIREKLFYDIWKKAGMVERRTSFVKLYINNAYYGLYTNLEEMEKEWLTRVYLQTGGNLYKCTYPADLVYHGPLEQTYKDLENETATGGRVYELQTNKSQDDYTRLVELITVLNQPAGGTFAQDIPVILNVDHFLKSLALDVATGNWDDYGYNRNNYYLYENPADSKVDFITYDPDNTFGVDWFGIDWGIRDCRNWINKSMSLPLSQKLLAVPAFYEKYKQYLDTIAKNIINPDTIFPRIDLLKQLIQQAAIEDTYRTLDYGYTVPDFNNSFIRATDNHTPYGLKPFLDKRKQSILSQLHPAGIPGNETTDDRITVFPNPAGETITFTLPNLDTNDITAKIYDLYGKLMLQFDLVDGNRLLSVQSLPPGMYILRVASPGLSHQTKFIRK